MLQKSVTAYFIRISTLVLGLVFFSLGVVLTMRANLGFAPWDVFHWGLGKTIGISIGNASILTGLVLCAAVLILGEKLGMGTILNMVLIGVFMDFLLALDFIPKSRSVPEGILMLTAGLFTISLGSYYYMKSAFGAGPRDSLMVAVRKITKFPVGLCRALIEGSTVLVGWVLGGPVGIGTIMAAAGIGLCIQMTFSLFRFEPAKVRHETLDMTWRAWRS